MPVYTQSSKVAAFLQVDDFDTTTTPTAVQVGEYIDRAESEIERRTNRAWKTVTVTDEYHALHPHVIYKLVYPPRVRLEHPFVKTFSAVSGDKLEVFDGTNWIDWIATKTEGRNGDFWVNYTDGIIFFERGFPLIWRQDQIRVTYRYGEATVAGWVEDVCTKMAAIMVMENYKQYAYSSPELAKADINTVISNWRAEIDEKLDEEKWITREKRAFVT